MVRRLPLLKLSVLTLVLVMTPLATLWALSQGARADLTQANSEVEYQNPANGEWVQVGPTSTPPWRLTGGPPNPGSPGYTATVRMRATTDNTQHVHVLFGIEDLSKLDADEQEKGNPSDLMFTVHVDGEQVGERRLGNAFAEDGPFEYREGVHWRLAVKAPVSGKNEEHVVTVRMWLPADSGNESQGVSFHLGILTVPEQAPSPTPTPTPDPTEEPSPTVDPTEEPTPTPDPTEEPTPTVDPTDEPSPTVDPTPSADPEPSGPPSAGPTAGPRPPGDKPREMPRTGH
ncbi:hypothetical protein [Enemella sp. A6]|uniref:hypothetical protein n=1 Tax=Enemella sp. A6 TaxID=3440152 RepID=UPI003EBF4C36